MARVVHFEIHADDPQRAVKFYVNLFGWKIDKWGESEYYLVTTGSDKEPGINGGLMKRRGDSAAYGQSVNAYVCTVKVDNVDNYIQKVEDNKGKIVVPKMAIGGVGYLVYCTDPEGNIFGIMHDDPSAK